MNWKDLLKLALAAAGSLLLNKIKVKPGKPVEPVK